MIGVGIDLIETSRIRKSVGNPRFFKKIFSELELQELKKKQFNIQSISARFCAKEAFAKAVGLGFRDFSFRDVQIFQDTLGKPYVCLDGKAKELFESPDYEFSVSLTHTKNYASAVVICNTKNEESGFNV